MKSAHQTAFGLSYPRNGWPYGVVRREARLGRVSLWRAWLGAATAYSTEHRIEKGTKTEIEKWLPVHPALHEHLVALGVPLQRHDESRSTFRSRAMADGADERDVDRLTHPSPKGASDLYTRTGVIWPRLCRAVEAIRIERPAHGHTRGDRAVTPPALRLEVGACTPPGIRGRSAEGWTCRKDGGTGESNPPGAPFSTPHRF